MGSKEGLDRFLSLSLAPLSSLLIKKGEKQKREKKRRRKEREGKGEGEKKNKNTKKQDLSFHKSHHRYQYPPTSFTVSPAHTISPILPLSLSLTPFLPSTLANVLISPTSQSSLILQLFPPYDTAAPLDVDSGRVQIVGRASGIYMDSLFDGLFDGLCDG